MISTVLSFLAKSISALSDLVPGWLWAAIFTGALAHGCVLEHQRDGLQTELDTLKADVVEAETGRLREANREISRLTGITNNLNEVHHDQLKTIDRLAGRLAAGGMRVTEAERDAAIARGSAEAVRDFATVADRNYRACRAEYVDLGRGYAVCASSARILDAFAKEVTGRPAAPTPPTPPTQP